MPKYTVFTEKDVRNSILKKANLVNINKDEAHWTGDIECNGKVVALHSQIRMLKADCTTAVLQDGESLVKSTVFFARKNIKTEN